MKKIAILLVAAMMLMTAAACAELNTETLKSLGNEIGAPSITLEKGAAGSETKELTFSAPLSGNLTVKLQLSDEYRDFLAGIELPEKISDMAIDYRPELKDPVESIGGSPLGRITDNFSKDLFIP